MNITFNLVDHFSTWTYFYHITFVHINIYRPQHQLFLTFVGLNICRHYCPPRTPPPPLIPGIDNIQHTIFHNLLRPTTTTSRTTISWPCFPKTHMWSTLLRRIACQRTIRNAFLLKKIVRDCNLHTLSVHFILAICMSFFGFIFTLCPHFNNQSPISSSKYTVKFGGQIDHSYNKQILKFCKSLAATLLHKSLSL